MTFFSLKKQRSDLTVEQPCNDHEMRTRSFIVDAYRCMFYIDVSKYVCMYACFMHYF